MRRIIFAAVFLSLLAARSSATTITVGPSGNYANISAALQSLGAAGRDGTPDIINVITDTLDNHPAILINGTAATAAGFPVLTDQITIDGNADGNANNCRLALGANVGTAPDVAGSYARIAVELSTIQKVTIKNFIIVPQALPSGGSVGGTAIVVDEGGASTTLADGCQFNLDNVLITGCDASNNPISTTAPYTGSPTRWGHVEGSGFASCLGFDDQPNTNGRFFHTISNCVFAHGRCDNVLVRADGGRIRFVNTRSSYCKENGFGDGFNLRDAIACPVMLEDSQADHNDGAGVALQGGNSTANTFTMCNVGAGCSFNDNDRGLIVQMLSTGLTKGLLTIGGSAEKPVRIYNNLTYGIRTHFSTASTAELNQIDSIRYAHIYNNDRAGIQFDQADMKTSPDISKCLFYRNGNSADGQITLQDSNPTSANIDIYDCTFHDPGKTAGTGAANLKTNSAATSNFTWNITNCIFSGTSGNDLAISNNSGSGVQYSILRSALVATGPHALKSPNALQTTPAVITLTSVINTDPLYLSSTDPTLSTFLDVNNGRPAGHPAGGGYITAAVGNTPLAGGADFVGGTVPVGLSGFSTD